jgi:hypothetical protein
MSSPYTAIKPLHIFVKFLGFAVFSIDDTSLDSSVKVLDFFFILAAVLISIFIHYVYWTAYFVIVLPKPSVVNATVPYISLCQNFVCIAITVVSFIKRKDICDILKKLREVDDEFLQHFGVKFDYKRQRTKVIRLMLLLLSFPGVVIVVRFVSGYKKQYKIGRQQDVLFYWHMSSAISIMVVFWMAALGVRSRFEGINRCLR